MHTIKKTLVAAALVSAGAAAQAEVSGSVGIASSYLWRGFDLGGGSGVVSGSLDYSSETGVYAGIWGSSGDDSYGTEYDLYLGWGGEVFEGFSVDVGYVDYNYPDCAAGNTPTNIADPSTIDTCDFEEIVVGFGFGAFGFTYVEPTTSGADYNYYALSGGFGDFSATYGMWDSGAGADGSHLDLTYGMGDLAFTLSQTFDDGAGLSEEVQFVVSYSIPLD